MGFSELLTGAKIIRAEAFEDGPYVVTQTRGYAVNGEIISSKLETFSDPISAKEKLTYRLLRNTAGGVGLLVGGTAMCMAGFSLFVDQEKYGANPIDASAVIGTGVLVARLGLEKIKLGVEALVTKNLLKKIKG